MEEPKSKIEKLAHDLQYGTSQEAEAAVAELLGLQEKGELPPNSGFEKFLSNKAMRDQIHERREDEVAKSIAGEDPHGDFPEESKLDSEGVMIEAGVPPEQQVIREAIKLYPNVANTLTLREAASQRVDQLVEDGKYGYDDPELYIAAFDWVAEWSTKVARIEDDAEREKAMQQYIKDRGQQFREEQEGDS